MKEFKNRREFEDYCYSLYQLDWMKLKGYSLQDVFDILRDGYIEAIEEGKIDGGSDSTEDFEYMQKYFNEAGFDGEGDIFVSKREFIETYMDLEPFMQYLLPKEVYAYYYKKYISC